VYDEELVNLDDWIRRLKVEYDIFFNGHRKKPPDDLRLRVEKMVKKLSECGNMSYGERFRYNTLLGRFYVYRDRWRRRLSERELGMEARAETAGPITQTDKRPPVSTEPISVSITDPANDEDKVRYLYDTLLKFRSQNKKAAPMLPYDEFAKYIMNQTKGIKSKHHCASVKFTLMLEEGALRFTARADENS
jgi:hypothetical protein